MTTVPVRVRGSLEIQTEALPPTALDLIKSGLSFHNEDKDVAQREEVFGWWDMPDTIDLWRVEARRGGDNVVLMPRGFAAGLNKILTSVGAKATWDDQRTQAPALPGYFRPFLFDERHDYQFDAVRVMLASQQGFYECPAGGGKTVAMLGFMAYANQRSLVIVDKADLVEQWREAAEIWLGLSRDFEHPRSVGKIGQGTWEERDLTIALRQTLWERIDELDATSWWAELGVEIFDEGHHLAADTLGEVARRCISMWMLGTSATPSRTSTKGKIVHAIVGPVIHRTSRKVLRERDILMEPTIEQIATEFEADFWKTHSVGKDEPCLMPGCKKSGKQKHGHRNNYTSVVKKLVEDERRNAQIAAEIVEDRGHIHLVPSRQLKHLDIIEKAVKAAGWDGPIFKLRGEENAKGISRDIVAEIRQAHEAVIFSTVADEALDIPPIDRVHIVFPMRQAGATIQLLGRGERVAEGKTDCIIKDYVDARMEVFSSQAEEREKVYRRQEFKLDRTVRMRVDEQAEPYKFSDGSHPFSSFSERWPIQVEHPMNGALIHVSTREKLFQAWKTLDEKLFMQIIQAPDSGKAKRLGNEVELREDWEDIKFKVMKSIIRDQCDQHPELAVMLAETGRRQIIEARPDPIWGEGSDGRGMNLLGKAWMEVREDLRLGANEVALAVGSGR